MTDQELSLEELRDGGYLQEANRQFFHPLGLSLAVRVDNEGKPYELCVLDCRDNPDGMAFLWNPDDPAAKSRLDKATKVIQEQALKGVVRQETLGWIVQPIMG